MNPTIHWATTVRILTQLRRDRRTVFMILLVPALLTVVLYFVLSRQPVGPDGRTPFDRLAINQLGVLPCAVMFPITAITMRRERSNGTLDRLFATPMTKLELLAGYGTAFSLAAAAQAVIVSFVAFRVTHLHIDGSPLLVVMISVLGAILGVSLGLFFSAFATTEYQAVQFAPIVLVPQLFLAGVLVPRDGDARMAASDQQRAAAQLCRRGVAAGQYPHRGDASNVARHRHHRRLHRRRTARWRRHPAATHPLNHSPHDQETSDMYSSTTATSPRRMYVRRNRPWQLPSPPTPLWSTG